MTNNKNKAIKSIQSFLKKIIEYGYIGMCVIIACISMGILLIILMISTIFEDLFNFIKKTVIKNKNLV